MISFDSFKGMHKKSLEAAETLKSSDEFSDREETKTEASDTSSSNIHRGSPITPIAGSTVVNNLKSKSNGSPPPSKSSSLSPATMSPPISHHMSHLPAPPTAASQQLQMPTENDSKNTLLSSPTSSRTPSTGSYHQHLSPHDQPQQQAHNPHQHPPPPLAHHHSLPAHHYTGHPMNPTPDTDPGEVFRWVNYNRDYPVSYIR